MAFEFELYTIDWNTIAAIAACIELIIIIIPALFLFVYFKIDYIDYWIYNQNENGMKIVIHNKSKSSIFLLKQILIVKSSYNKKYSIPFKTNPDTQSIQIKSDDYIVITIDFGLYNITSDCDVNLQLDFGGKRKRIIKLQKRTK